MKAIVYEKYGSPDVLSLKEVEKPMPKKDEVLIKIVAASVNAADWRLLRGDPFLVRLDSGILKPKHKILGMDVAGIVEAIGSNATQLKVGDEVLGDLFENGKGGFAEYTCSREDALVPKPKNISFEEAAAIPLAGLTALHGLRDKGNIQPGQKVLINGASGGVGTYAIQIAKVLGAQVTAVCGTHNIETARSLGADHTIDYTKDDFTKSGIQYDLILACNGFHTVSEYLGSLKPNGKYFTSGGNLKQVFHAMLFGPWISMVRHKKIGVVSSFPNQTDLAFLINLVEEGKVRPVIDRRYPLEKVPEALWYLEEGHARGKVVIQVASL